MGKDNEKPAGIYNRAKVWQLILFTCNDVSFNVYFIIMSFVSYYATGVVGMGVVMVSYLLTAMRIFDGITDPLIGRIMDRTNTKFGKFRPFMVGGNLIMAVSVLIMFFTTHKFSGPFRIFWFILIYAIYIIGYTCQGAATRAGQSCLTTDPRQRPVVSIISGTGCSVLAAGIQMMVSGYLITKYGEMGVPFFQELIIIGILISAVLTVLAVIGIWRKDRPEFYGTGSSKQAAQKVPLKDYLDVIKNNRGLQMLIVAASTDKLANTVSGNAIVSIMVFGIICKNYAVSGQMAMLTLFPTLIVLFAGVRVAQKMGQRKAVVVFSALSIVFQTAVLLLFLMGNPAQINMTQMNLFTIAFLICYIMTKGCMGVPASLVIPMITDCSDFEIYRSGRYVPGLMATLFSFVDKTISAFGNTIVGLLIALIGYTAIQPSPADELTTGIFVMSMILWCGLPILAWICSIVAMKFSPLTSQKMEEVQAHIAELRDQNVNAVNQNNNTKK